MFTGNSFGKSIDVLQRTMDTALIRRQVIANNISNADTPNFKRSDVNFEAELERALDSEDKKVFPEARMTDSRHIPFNRPRDYRDVRPRRVLDYLTTTDNNGNNVDIEQEMMMATQNQMMYQVMTQAVNNQFRQVNLVLR